MVVVAGALRMLAFVGGIVQLLWITRYVWEDFGIWGIVAAWLVFPLTLLVSPIYGVLAHDDWLGVVLFVVGPATYLVLGLIGHTPEREPTPEQIEERYLG